MKKLSLYFLFALAGAPLLLSAQHADKGSLQVSAGASLPAGAFADKSLNTTSGMAQPGPTIEFRYHRPLNEHLGALLALGGQYNPFNRSAMESELNKARFYDGIYTSSGSTPPSQIPYSTYQNWSIDHAGWWTVYLQAGLTARVALDEKEKSQLQFELMAGAAWVKSPALHGKSISDTAAVTIQQTSKSAWGFSYSFGTSYQRQLNSRIYGIAGLSWLGTAKLNFKNVKSSLQTIRYQNGTPVGIFEYHSTGSGSQVIGCLRISLGIGFPL